MKLTNITLTPELERALVEQAHKQGTTPQRLALDYLRERFLPPVATGIAVGEQETLADFLADHIGVLSSREHVPGGARMSENSGKKFAAGLSKMSGAMCCWDVLRPPASTCASSTPCEVRPMARP